MSAPNPLASPALSTASASSFVMLSDNSLPSSNSVDSDDEIIYTVTEDDDSSADESLDSDILSEDDFVVLSRPRSQRSILTMGLSTPKESDDDRADAVANITIALANLTVTDIPAPRRRQKAKAAPKVVVSNVAVAKKKKTAKAKVQPSPATTIVAYPSPGPSPARPKHVSASTTPIASDKQVAAPLSKKNKKKAVGLGDRSIVDDTSDRLSDFGGSDAGPSIYEEAVGFITSFLSNPAARKDTACRLTLLQSLIIELGLAYSSLPSSLTAAKAFLKSRAFLNIREYIAVRDQGPAAVQRIMHPSRSALIKDIRKNKNKAPLNWVKDSGLQVLLVQCYN